MADLLNNDPVHSSLIPAQSLFVYLTSLEEINGFSSHEMQAGIWTGAIWLILILKKNKESIGVWRKILRQKIKLTPLRVLDVLA